MLTLEDWEPIQRPNLTSRRRGRRAPKGADGAHGAASGARTAKGREADRRDSGDGRARAPRATDFGQRPKDAGGCAPAPAKISAWVRAAGEHDEGKGGAPRGRGGGRGTTRRETERPALPHADQTPRNRRRKRPEARRGRAGRTQRSRASPSRGRMRERGQRPSRPDRRRRGGQRAREQLPPTTRTRDGATTPADGETAARWAATAQRANLAACAPLWRFFPLVVGSGAYFVEKALERAKKRKKGACYV